MPKAVPMFVEKVQDRRRDTNERAIKADDRPGPGGGRIRSRDSLLPKIPESVRGQATSLTNIQRDLIAPWLGDITFKGSYPTVFERLHAEIVAFTSWVSPTPREEKATQSIVASITDSIVARFSGGGAAVQVNLFGSLVNGLAFPDSDINMEILLERRVRMRLLHQSVIEAGLAPRKRGICTVSPRHYGQNLPSVQFSLVPELGSRIVTLTCAERKIDLSSVEEINNLLSRHSALKPLYYVLKSFLSQRCLTGGECGMTSYALLKLCARFLESNPCRRTETELKESIQARSLGVLLVDFFYYFGFFNAEAVAEALLVRSFYVDKRIQLPERTSRVNLTDHVQACFQFTWNYLTTRSAEDRNLLGPVVAVNHKMVKRRADIEKLLCSGRLDQMAGDIERAKSKFRSDAFPFPGKENEGALKSGSYPPVYDANGLPLPRAVPPGGGRLRCVKHIKAEAAARAAEEPLTPADGIHLQFGRLGL